MATNSLFTWGVTRVLFTLLFAARQGIHSSFSRTCRNSTGSAGQQTPSLPRPQPRQAWRGGQSLAIEHSCALIYASLPGLGWRFRLTLRRHPSQSLVLFLACLGWPLNSGCDSSKSRPGLGIVGKEKKEAPTRGHSTQTGWAPSAEGPEGAEGSPSAEGWRAFSDFFQKLPVSPFFDLVAAHKLLVLRVSSET